MPGARLLTVVLVVMAALVAAAAGAGSVRPASLTPAERHDLLSRFTPILYFHGDETWSTRSGRTVPQDCARRTADGARGVDANDVCTSDEHARLHGEPLLPLQPPVRPERRGQVLRPGGADAQRLEASRDLRTGHRRSPGDADAGRDQRDGALPRPLLAVLLVRRLALAHRTPLASPRRRLGERLGCGGRCLESALRRVQPALLGKRSAPGRT